MLLSKFIGKIMNKKDKYAIVILIAIVVLKTCMFDYVNWNITTGGRIDNLLSLCLLFYWIFYIKGSQQMNFRKEVYFMMFLPFLSVFNSWSIYGQSPIDGAWVLISNFIWIIYFLLHKYKVSESALLKVFLIVSLVIVLIQIIQQFTYPNVLFGVMSVDEMIEKGVNEVAEMRNGLWRFRMSYGAYFTAPILFAMWVLLQKKFNINLCAWVILLLVSVYLALTRQVIASCIITIIFSFFINSKGKLKAFLLMLFFAGFLYLFYDILFSSLAEQTSEENSDDNIRLLAAAYYWEESLKTPFTFLFGIGKGVGNSALAQMQEIQNTVYNFFVGDVGLIGEIYERGLVYVLTSYYLMYKLFIRLRNVIPIYIRMFVLFTALMSIMIFPFILYYQILVWAILLYISDLHINSNKI